MRRSLSLLTALALALAGCASKRPVLYPNAMYEQLGEASAEEIVNSCLERARAADLSDSRTTGAAKSGTFGGAVGAVIGGAIGWILGSPGKGAAVGAVHGGGSGAVSGAAKSGESAPTFRSWVETCLHEQGLQPVGWR
ncbi:MAG: hypothetical protein JRG76_17575 [Deltaproteobacteria bacterium]|nr:hypothetical protein [Deltaproteobacteria bacterium]MBW2416311.1 hypothetical protein [Deltaproteobacteria bacterium]